MKYDQVERIPKVFYRCRRYPKCDGKSASTSSKRWRCPKCGECGDVIKIIEVIDKKKGLS